MQPVVRILVTRPEPDATELAARLARDGHQAICAPLLTVEAVPGWRLPVAVPQALLATSRHALALLARHDDAAALLGIPVFTVGNATAAAARELGWAKIVAATGTAQDLIAVVAAGCDPRSGPLLHARGADITVDLAAALTPLGFTVYAPVLYGTHPVSTMPLAMQVGLGANALDAAILLSAKTARTYAALLTAAGLWHTTRNLAHYCLSEVVAEVLNSLGPCTVKVPETPDLEQLIAVVNRDAAQFRLELK